MQARVGRVLHSVYVNLRCHAGVADKGLGVAKVEVIKLRLDEALNVSGEALVKPDILPVVGGDLVAGPLLRDVSHEHVLLRFVANDGSL